MEWDISPTILIPSGNLLQFAIDNGDLVRGFSH